MRSPLSVKHSIKESQSNDQLFQSCPDPLCEVLRPIFIVGPSRSGTTMMAMALSRSRDVFSFKELHFFEQLWSPDSKRSNLSWSEAEKLAARLIFLNREGYLSTGTEAPYLGEAAKMLELFPNSQRHAANIYKFFLQYETRRASKVYPCEQTPRNIFYMSDILELFPNARFIHMVRDPRAVLASQKGKWKRRKLSASSVPFKEDVRTWINYHPLIMSKLWRSANLAACSLSNDHRIISVRFEDVVSNPREVLHRVCRFLGLEYSEKMLDIPHTGSSYSSDDDSKRGINSETADRWKGKLSASEVFWSQKINADLMNVYGYQKMAISPCIGSLAASILLLPFKLVLALLLNMGRMRSLKSAIKRRM